jgi:hypothetical protein
MLSNEILDIAVVNWNGTGAPEVAVLYDEGIKVYNGSPTPIATIEFDSVDPPIPTPLDGGTLAAFRQDGLAYGRLAAVVEPPSDDPLLCVFDIAGYPFELYEYDDLSIVIGTTTSVIDGTYALAAGDLDGNNSDEIVVSHVDSSFDGPVVFTNLCTSAGNCDTFDASSAEVLDLGVSWTTPTPQAKPVLDDLTSDGDLDLAWFQQGDTLLRLAENTTEDHTEQFVGIIPGQSEGRHDSFYNPPLEKARSLFTAFSGPWLLDENPFAFDPNFILIEEWYEGDYPLELDPVGVEAFSLPYPEQLFQGPVTMDMMLWPIPLLRTGLVHLTIRGVSKDLSGALIAAGPAATYTMANGSAAKEGLLDRLDDLGLPMFEIAPRAWNLPDFTGSLPAYIVGPFDPNNAVEGVGGGQPPRPPPGPDEIDPPKAPINP